jgi:hypothetical protein
MHQPALIYADIRGFFTRRPELLTVCTKGMLVEENVHGAAVLSSQTINVSLEQCKLRLWAWFVAVVAC